MKAKNFVLGVAIMIVTIAVIVYGISTFYHQPLYEDFCNPIKTQEIINNSEQCISIGGQWSPYPSVKNGVEGWCDRDFQCSIDYAASREVYRRNIFFIALPLGIFIIAIGALLFNLEAVGAGLMAGGVGTMLYGIGGYWRYTDDWMKFSLSFIGLVALIFLTYYLNQKRKKKFFKI